MTQTRENPLNSTTNSSPQCSTVPSRHSFRCIAAGISIAANVSWKIWRASCFNSAIEKLPTESPTSMRPTHHVMQRKLSSGGGRWPPKDLNRSAADQQHAATSSSNRAPNPSPRLPRLRIQDIRRPLPLKKCHHILGRDHSHLRPRLQRCRRNVRRQYHIRPLQSRVNERLLLIHIQRRPRQFFALQRVHERRLVHHRPARSIDQKSGRLHLRKLRNIEQPARVRR